MRKLLYKIFNYKIFCIFFPILIIGLLMLMIENLFSIYLYANIIILIAGVHVSVNLFLRAFDPFPVYYNWPLVFPELLLPPEDLMIIREKEREKKILEDEISILKEELLSLTYPRLINQKTSKLNENKKMNINISKLFMN